MGELITQDAPKGILDPGVVAGAKMMSLIPTTLEGVWRMAQIIAKSPFCPKDMNTVEACSSAIMLGLDVGLNPIQAVQSIAVINNRPSIWGDAALALCISNPLCEDVTEEFSGDPNKVETWFWTCTAIRKGRANPIVRTFSYEDAKRAGLWNKAGPWQNYPKRMLQLRARAFALRDAFPDILKGLAIREEMEDVVHDDGARRQPRSTPKPPGTASDIIDAEARDVTGQPEATQTETAKPAEPVKEPAKAEPKKADPKPTPKAAETVKPKEEPKPAEPEKAAETKPADDSSDFPGDPNYKPPGDQQQDEQDEGGDRVPDYKGSELLAEFSEAMDGFDDVADIDAWLGKGKGGKPNRGMVIVDALNPADQQEARELYKAAKDRINAHAAGAQTQGGGDAEHDGDADTQENNGAETGDAGEETSGDADVPARAEGDEQGQDPATMSWDEYNAYARAYIDAATDKEMLKKIWFSESKIRTDLEKAGAPKKECEELKMYRTAKIDQLSGTA